MNTPLDKASWGAGTPFWLASGANKDAALWSRQSNPYIHGFHRLPHLVHYPIEEWIYNFTSPQYERGAPPRAERQGFESVSALRIPTNKKRAQDETGPARLSSPTSKLQKLSQNPADRWMYSFTSPRHEQGLPSQVQHHGLESVRTRVISKSKKRAQDDCGPVSLSSPRSKREKLSSVGHECLFTPFLSRNLGARESSSEPKHAGRSESENVIAAFPTLAPYAHQSYPILAKPYDVSSTASIHTDTSKSSTSDKQRFASVNSSRTQSMIGEKADAPKESQSLENFIYTVSKRELDAAPNPRMMRSVELWYKWLNELVQFKQEHGHCRVPQKYSSNQQLANWVNRQRCNVKHSKERLEVLNAVGFEWAKRRVDSWEKMFRELDAFEKKNGHCNVPTKLGPLGNWVSRQRAVYNNRTMHMYETKKKRDLWNERFEKLDHLGFDWIAPVKPQPNNL